MRRFFGFTLTLCVLAACAAPSGQPQMSERVFKPTESGAQPAPVRQTTTLQTKWAQNYCFTDLKGKKTWNSFIQRNDTLKVSPRDKSRRVAYYRQVSDGVWKDRDGTSTYELIDGGAVWRANNGSGKSIQLREC